MHRFTAFFYSFRKSFGSLSLEIDSVDVSCGAAHLSSEFFILYHSTVIAADENICWLNSS